MIERDETSLASVIANAAFIARFRRVPEVATQDLLLALLADPSAASLIRLRGGWTYDGAVRRERVPGPLPQHWQLPAAPGTVVVVGVSVRLVAVSIVARAGRWTLRVLRVIRVVEAAGQPGVPFSRQAATAIEMADRLVTPKPANVFHLLAVLASQPGPHLPLVGNPTLVAAAARRRCGFANKFDRVVLLADFPRHSARLIDQAIRRGRIRSGWISIFGLLRVGTLSLDGLFTLIYFVLGTLATCLLYIFLLPAALLLLGLRAVVGATVRRHVTTRHWTSVVGGEIDLLSTFEPIGARAVSVITFAPRLLAFLIGLTTITAAEWSGITLGDYPFPNLYSRPDLLISHHLPAPFVGQLVIVVDAITSNGFINGVGLLAGIGVGALAFPTYREIQAVRIYSGHDKNASRSLFTRLLSAPATLASGTAAISESILPFANAPFFAGAGLIALVIEVIAAATFVHAFLL